MYLADTNILLRFLLRNDPAYPAIRLAVRILKTRREQLVTTPQNIAEFWNVCTRPRNGERRLRFKDRSHRAARAPAGTALPSFTRQPGHLSGMEGARTSTQGRGRTSS